ncbi:histone H2B type 1-L-like [Carcharodon carcharias]|uniref:histone H2B type 1-L-like n=1 Tax=Carcharodon carcharias TaxID=13397 RepID=UPI001B7ECC87|nr:histone H2B type 1-L-like [Carcharodon carcharias]
MSCSKSSGIPEVVAAAKGGASHKASKQSLTKVTRKLPKQQRKSRKQSYSTYVYRHISSEASHLIHYNKCHTIPAREIQSVICLMLPGELAKHANFKGTKAVTKYTNSI